MVKLRYVQVRVTDAELARIKNNAAARGFPTASAYIRSFALDRDLWFEKKLQEIIIILRKLENGLGRTI